MEQIEYSSHAPEPVPPPTSNENPYPRLPPHLLLPTSPPEPDYLRLILTSKVYDIVSETPLVLATNLSTESILRANCAPSS